MSEHAFSELNEEAINAIRKTYSTMNTLDEEKKSISEDIREEKQQCAKASGLSVRQLNGLFKILKAREKGEFDEDLVNMARAVEGIKAPKPSSE